MNSKKPIVVVFVEYLPVDFSLFCWPLLSIYIVWWHKVPVKHPWTWQSCHIEFCQTFHDRIDGRRVKGSFVKWANMKNRSPYTCSFCAKELQWVKFGHFVYVPSDLPQRRMCRFLQDDRELSLCTGSISKTWWEDVSECRNSLPLVGRHRGSWTGGLFFFGWIFYRKWRLCFGERYGVELGVQTWTGQWTVINPYLRLHELSLEDIGYVQKALC